MAAVPRRSLLALPVELKVEILCNLPDSKTLKSITKAHSSFNEILAKYLRSIIWSVLFNTLPRDLLPESLSLLYSKKLKTIDYDNVRHNLKSHYFRWLKRPPSRNIYLNEAISMKRNYRLIHQFALDFAANALTRNPVTEAHEPCKKQPSQAELLRIERNFYLFELYVTLFKGYDKQGKFIISIKDQQSLFFYRFAPWEIEQLACIHDYLYHGLRKAYDEVSAHDIEWGELDRASSDYLYYEPGRPIYGVKASYLPIGLKYLYKLIHAKTYKERHKLLTRGDVRFRREFLDAALQTSNSPCDDVPLSSYDEATMNQLIPRFQDSDTGPAEVWRVTHLNYTCNSLVMSYEHRKLREWGYVLWDHERLRNWGFFSTPWQPPPREEYDRSRFIELQESEQRRTEIWLKGGIGWWSKDDESHVRYVH